MATLEGWVKAVCHRVAMRNNRLNTGMVHAFGQSSGKQCCTHTKTARNSFFAREKFRPYFLTFALARRWVKWLWMWYCQFWEVEKIVVVRSPLPLQCWKSEVGSDAVQPSHKHFGWSMTIPLELRKYYRVQFIGRSIYVLGILNCFDDFQIHTKCRASRKSACIAHVLGNCTTLLSFIINRWSCCLNTSCQYYWWQLVTHVHPMSGSTVIESESENFLILKTEEKRAKREVEQEDTDSYTAVNRKESK